MAITLGSNIASLRGQRQLSRTSEELGTVFQRLSSGQRINKASDDAAGLSIADSLSARSRIYNQGVRNLNDGLSLLSIADSAIENISSIVMRLEELAAQAANGTYSNKQRNALNTEAQMLADEFERISKASEFNGLGLFDGDISELRLQAGYGINGSISAGLGGALGTATFSSATSYAMDSAYTYDIAIGDLNGDGLIDVVSGGITDASSGSVTVRLGQTGGSLGSATTYSGESASSVAVTLADVNNDGSLDLISAGSSTLGAGYATVRLGLGNGSFGSAVSYQMEGGGSRDVISRDLNGDGYSDLITAGYGGSGVATVRLGLGNGTFGSAVSYTSGAGSYYDAVAVGDLNRDGIPDLVTAGASAAFDGWLTVRMGRGDGTFNSATSWQAEDEESMSVVLTDINNDGILDVATSGRLDTSTGSATIRLGLGNGSFSAANSISLGGESAFDITAGDFNGDGLQDFAVAMYDAPGGSVRLLLGNGNGTFKAYTNQSTGSYSACSIAVGDLNGDGVFDLVTEGENYTVEGQVTINFGNTRNGIQPLLPFSLETVADARQALPMLQRKRELLGAQRGQLGAFHARLEIASNTLRVSGENFLAAAARIRDADIADESSRLVRLNILQQAATSVLAQSNQQPALALQLLRG